MTEKATASGIETLPDHLKTKIAAFLDRRSAIALATTSASLRDAAEYSVWSELNVSLQRPFMDVPLPYDFTRPLGGGELYRIRQRFHWADDVNDLERWEMVTEGMDTFLVSLIGFLNLSSKRRTAVRTLYFDLDQILPTAFVDLLKLVAPTLTRLDFLPSGFPYTPRSRPDLSKPNAYTPLTTPLPYLRHLQLVIDVDWDKTLDKILRLTPGLRSLRLISGMPYSGGCGEHTVFPPAEKKVWAELPMLEWFEVDQMSPHFEANLAEMVRSSPGLRRVSLPDPTQIWDLRSSDLIGALSRLDHLEYLHISSDASLQSFSALKRLSLKQTGARKRTLKDQLASVPKLEQLENLYLYSYSCPDDAKYTWGGDWGALPCGIRDIPQTVMEYFTDCPALLQIQYPGVVENEQTFLPSEYDWPNLKPPGRLNRIVLIRTYVCGNDDAVAHDTFTHCRSFTAQHCHVDGDVVYRAQDVWEEYTDFNGTGVPANVLAQVYNATGESVVWFRPGRNLELSQTAWAILRGWSSSLETSAIEGTQEDSCIKLTPLSDEEKGHLPN